MGPLPAQASEAISAIGTRALAVSSTIHTIHKGARELFCHGASSVPPTGTTAVCMLTALGLLRLHVRSTSVAQATRSIYLMVNFVLVLNYTVVILDSYDLCKTLGLSGGASGRMVGMYMLGFCAGAVAMWLTVRQRPKLWRESPQRVLLAWLSFQLVGACIYAWVGTEAAGARHRSPDDSFSGPYQELLHFMLMASRFISGIGSGSCQQFYVSGMLHLTPPVERSVHTARWVFSGMLAIGLGPMLAAAMQQLQPCHGTAHYQLVGHVQIIVAMGSMTAVGLLHPDLEDVDDCMEPSLASASGSSGSTEKRLGERRRIVLGCLGMVSLRAFGVSAIEVVIAMILEQKYHWDQRVTGLTIGAIFLCCVPLKILHSNLRDAMPVLGWIRLLAGIAVVGSFLLRTSTPEALSSLTLPIGGAQMLMLAGVIVFPTFYLSDALGSGIMHQHVLPEGSLLDGNHAQLWYNFAQGMGRFLGPWLARRSVQANGQDSFAMQQVFVTLAFLCIFEALVRPNLQEETPRSEECFRMLLHKADGGEQFLEDGATDSDTCCGSSQSSDGER